MKARKIQKVARPETLFVYLQAKLEGLAPQGVLLASALTVSPRSVLLSFVALLSLVIWGVWSLAPKNETTVALEKKQILSHCIWYKRLTKVAILSKFQHAQITP